MIYRTFNNSSTQGILLFLLSLLVPSVSSLSAEVSPSVLLTKHDLRKGIFLVATPFLLDPSFKKTVVLICEHEEEGALGLIINRPTTFPLSKAFPEIPGLKKLSDTVYQGGPVQPRGLLMLFRSENGSENTKLVLDGVFWGGDPGMMASMVENPDPKRGFRVFAGYAGWSPGQLEKEIQGGFWNVLPASPESIFDHDPNTLWKELFEKSTHLPLLVFNPENPRLQAQLDTHF